MTSRDEMPLRCEHEAGTIQMWVGTKMLRFAAENHPYFWDGESGANVPNIKIADHVAFAEAVVQELNREAEDGSTLVTQMMDEAIKQAVENGCEGVDPDDA